MSDLEHGSTVGGSVILTQTNLPLHTHTAEQINGLSEAIKRQAIPIGMTYVQFPGRGAPASLFGGTWSAIFDNEGIFFRTPGGNASSFGGGIQGDAIRNITGNTFAHNTWSGLVKFTQSGVFQAVSYGGGFNVNAGGGDTGHYLNFNASRVVPTASENRPRNRTIRVWVKTAH